MNTPILTRKASIWLLLALLAALLVPAPPLVRAAGEAPQFLREISSLSGQIEDATNWAVGGGFLYWTNCGAPGTGYLRRWPVSGGRVAYLASGGVCPTTMTADASGLYYYDSVTASIMARLASDPTTAQVVAAGGNPNGDIVVDAGSSSSANIYWLEGSTSRVIRGVRKSNLAPLGIGPEPVSANATSLASFGQNLLYFANGNLNSVLKICLGIGGGTCPKTLVTAASGSFLNGAALVDLDTFFRTSPLWVNDRTIQGHWCRPSPNCIVSNIYTAPVSNGNAYYPGRLASEGQYLFWVERQCSGAPDFVGCEPLDTGRLMKLNLQRSTVANPFDTPQPIACQNCNATYSINTKGEQIGTADGWVFFKTSRGISRMRVDAPPVSWDLTIARMEVTQGVQGLSNDVQLIADKTTYVRVYGNKLSGPEVRGVAASLSGFDASGASLPGSPLRPINGVQDLLVDNVPIERGDQSKSWIFELPAEWVRAGTISLRPRVDPQRIWRDPDTLNNASLRSSFTFIRKAPICIVFIPVRTSPAVQMFGPSHWFAIDMVRRQLPTPDVWMFSQDSDVAEVEARFGIPPWRFGPYELEDDSNKIMLSLWLRDQLSDDPEQCDNARARTHYVGVAHADAGGSNGTGRLGGDQLWFRLPPDNLMADWMTDRAVTLAHELAHNYGRRHVDCPVGDPDDVGTFPYPTCQIDQDDGVERHYGFTYNAFQNRFVAIAPTTVGDLMSYAHRAAPPKSRWISDFSWGGILNEIPNGAAIAEARLEVVGNADLAASSSVVLISGLVDPADLRRAEIGYAWTLPSGAVSQRMLQKWQRSAAPASSYARANTLAAGNYHLRLLDASGAVLDDRAIVLDTHADQEGSLQTWQLTMPAPAGQVARIELMDGTNVIASRTPGASQPKVEIVAPGGGERFDTEMTLSWRATDADSTDALLYTVQYSPDNGKTWRALLTDFPNLSGTDSVTVPLRSLNGLPSSAAGGLIRVLASDGYHTGIAVSKPFSIPNRGPQPTISTPWPGQSIAAGQSITLQGAAIDADDGNLSGQALRWSLNGAAIGSGQRLAIGDLAPGQHSIGLTARDADGSEQSITTTLTVEALHIPLAAEPTLDGDCADGAYAGAATVQLMPTAAGGRPTVRLVRSASHLWACFTNMERANGSEPQSLAVMRVDVNHSRDGVPQAGDYGFSLGEDGVPDTFQGNGTYTLDTNGPGGLAGMTMGTGVGWQAEMRIDASVLGGWNKVVGLDVEQAYIPVDGVVYWPRGAIWHNPASWATTVLGEVPQIATLAPDTALAGGAEFTLTVNGSGFGSGSVMQWDGQTRPTMVVSATQLRATITAADLAVARTLPVSVAGAGGTSSNALQFVVSAAPIRSDERSEWQVMLPLVRR